MDILAQKRTPILLTGESGTGKGVAARYIHDRGPRRNAPFISVDLAALAPMLIESELFGHVRGAFTGAVHERPGLLATPREGTVFFDEVSELDHHLQARLLSVRQDQEYKPVGSNSRLRFNARIISATNQDLDAAVARGTFRKDLYYRLNVFRLDLPPLRERKEDIPALVHHFINRHSEPGDRTKELSSDALDYLFAYNWPGNVRELENCVRYALALSQGPEIRTEHLPHNITGIELTRSQTGIPSLREIERQIILDVLKATGGKRLLAAKLLGIGKTTIYRKTRGFAART